MMLHSWSIPGVVTEAKQLSYACYGPEMKFRLFCIPTSVHSGSWIWQPQLKLSSAKGTPDPVTTPVILHAASMEKSNRSDFDSDLINFPSSIFILLYFSFFFLFKSQLRIFNSQIFLTIFNCRCGNAVIAENSRQCARLFVETWEVFGFF